MSHNRLALFAAAGIVTAAIIGVLLVTHPNSTGPESPPPGAYRGSAHPGEIRLPAFSLRDQDGTRVSTRDLSDRVVVLTFLDTDCKSSCPIIAGIVGAAIPRLTAAERGRVKALAITVNPAADSRAKVRQFLRDHRAAGSLDFLGGSLSELQPVWQVFQVLAVPESGDADIHSAPVRIYDRRGVWVSTLHPGVDLTPVNLVHDIREALRTSS